VSPGSTETPLEFACGGSDLGATHPDQFSHYDYGLARSDCPTCDSFLTITAPCTASVGSAAATLSDRDCRAVTTWLTSDLWLHAIDTGALCAGNDGLAFPPQFVDEDVAGAYHGWKSSTPACHGALLPRQYACMQALLNSYFPGMKLAMPAAGEVWCSEAGQTSGPGGGATLCRAGDICGALMGTSQHGCCDPKGTDCN
jgi:hypothetical protein